jgi:hypothetical protein
MLMIALGLISIGSYGQDETDTTKAWNLYRPQQQINKDSIDARTRFIQDSIQAREQFVRDSTLRRKHILDSLTFLQGELQPLLEAIYRTTSEDIITHADNIAIIGDSVLGDFVYHKLPLILSEPYTPWKGRLSLNAKQIHFSIDQETKKISLIKGPSLLCGLSYTNEGMIIIIHEDYMLQKNSSGNFFRFPLDSVFYDRYKQIVKIKRYVQFYDLLPNNRKGALLFTNLSQVKQYQYDTNHQMTKYELVKFCDRYKAYDKNEVCSIINYAVSKQDNTYQITRRNNPENEFSDGTFTLEFDEHENVKSISFRVLSNNMLKWQWFVELNKEGNVSCYIEKTNGVTGGTRCMIYHNEPNAKYPVEIINTYFEKDGVDYSQTNITTGKTRERNRMTLEWGPWK